MPQIRELKAGRGQKPVTNVVVKAEDRQIDLAAWGPLADRISGKDGIIRLDAVSVIPAQKGDKASAKLTTSDCSSILDATEAEREHLLRDLLQFPQQLINAQEDIQNVSLKQLINPSPVFVGPEVADDAAMSSLTVNSFTPKREIAMTGKASVTSLEMLSLSLASEFDPATAGSGSVFQATYEIPSVMILGFSGPDPDRPWEYTYRGCPKCNFTKLPEDGTCPKCGKSDYEDRYWIKASIIDPTDSVQGVMFHESAKE